MANVYVTRYDFMNAYGSARKAIESLIDGNIDPWEAIILENPDEMGVHVDHRVIMVTKENVGQLITILNKQGYLSLVSGNESMEIQKMEVM